jgi:hypothetical protein
MKKQTVLLKKLNLTKSKVASINSNQIVGGTLYDMTDNGCGPEMSVWPNICPVSHNCPPATHTCQTVNCQSFACQSFACGSVFCASVVTC